MAHRTKNQFNFILTEPLLLTGESRCCTAANPLNIKPALTYVYRRSPYPVTMISLAPSDTNFKNASHRAQDEIEISNNRPNIPNPLAGRGSPKMPTPPFGHQSITSQKTQIMRIIYYCNAHLLLCSQC